METTVPKQCTYTYAIPLKCKCLKDGDYDLDMVIYNKNRLLNVFHELGFAADFIKLNDDLSFNIFVYANVSNDILQKFIAYFRKYSAIVIEPIN